MEKIIHCFAQHLPAFGVGSMHNLGAESGAFGMLFQDKRQDFLHSLQEGAFLADIVVLAVGFIDLDNWFDASQRSQQAFQVADSAASNQVF